MGRRPFWAWTEAEPEERREESVAQVVEIPELQPWFLVHWASTTHPDVLMEFETQDEAEGALRAAFAEIAAGAGEELDVFPMTVCPALTMFEEPELRDALARWDAQLVELESRTRSTMDDLFPKRAS
ncbi:MAG: hypothetical protein ACRDGW_04225 [Actinomycetota bacterium]